MITLIYTSAGLYGKNYLKENQWGIKILMNKYIARVAI
jgi:hypothetical protein